MSPRKKKVTPRVSTKARRELDALAAKILAGDAEALERFLMQQLYGEPTETDVEPALVQAHRENDSPVDPEPGP